MPVIEHDDSAVAKLEEVQALVEKLFDMKEQKRTVMKEFGEAIADIEGELRVVSTQIETDKHQMRLPMEEE